MNNETMETKEKAIEKYLFSFLKNQRAGFIESIRIYKKILDEHQDNRYILKIRRELSRYNRLKSEHFEIKKLRKFLKKYVIGDNIYFDKHFLTGLSKEAMQKRDLSSLEWEVDDKTPMYSFDTLFTNIINTKQLLNEYEKGVIFAKDKDKNTFRTYFETIDNLRDKQKEKLIKYATVENRQELLSYLKNENIIKILDIQEEINHLNNISLMPNEQKIIRSFKYYLDNLFNDNSLMKKDVTKKRNVDKLFRDVIKHYFDKDTRFEEYYLEDARQDYKKLKKVRQSHQNQSFNFHDIKFSNFS